MAALAFANPALHRIAGTAPSLLARILISAGMTLALWETRSRTRQSLRSIDPLLFPDLGLTTAEVLREVEKPFWRA